MSFLVEEQVSCADCGVVIPLSSAQYYSNSAVFDVILCADCKAERDAADEQFDQDCWDNVVMRDC